jgi:hypothetical protein
MRCCCSLQKELLRRGLNVTSGRDEVAAQDSQLDRKYVDDWKWEIKM